MTRYISNVGDVLHATARMVGDPGKRNEYSTRKRRPFVHDTGECVLCHVRRERVNGVCLVCRANGAGDDDAIRSERLHVSNGAGDEA